MDIEWPSTRVPHGGIFHPPKVHYSKETHDLIKLLMEEAHLTMMQRKKINYHLRNGDPLPLPHDNQKCLVSEDENMQAYNIIMRVKHAKKRSLQTIKATGAYEKDKYIASKHLKESSEHAKLRLQQLMSGIREYPEIDSMKMKNKYKHKRAEREEWPDPITEILNEIYERANWLTEMEEIGEGKKHRDVIQAQIAERLREIRRLEKERIKFASIQKLQESVKRDIDSRIGKQ